MRIEMIFECETCQRVRKKIVPVRFHYSDGCYTVLTIEDPKCRWCEDKEETAVRR